MNKVDRCPEKFCDQIAHYNGKEKESSKEEEAPLVPSLL
jgi:hypothetical protein